MTPDRRILLPSWEVREYEKKADISTTNNRHVIRGMGLAYGI